MIVFVINCKILYIERYYKINIEGVCFFVLKGLKYIYFMFWKGELKNYMKNFKKSIGKILLVFGLVVFMLVCSVINLFGEKEKINVEFGK